MDLEIRILGPLDVLVRGTPVPLGGRLQRAVLALLVLQRNEVVLADRLIDRLWEETPPGTATNLLQGYVSGLRKALGHATIATHGRGYAAMLPDGVLDLERFERRAEAAGAQQQAGRAAEASSGLREALALWRGPALADLADLRGLRPVVARLDELRLVALERCAEAELECGRHAEVAAELSALTAEHPLRERLRALHMLALYRGGRQAEALEAFRAARAQLVGELGIEPGAELHDLARAILRHDPTLAVPGGGGPVTHGRRAVPAPSRTVLAAALTPAAAPLLGAVGALLARDGELVLATTVADASDLDASTQSLRAVAASGEDDGTPTRVAAFTSLTPGSDLARLARDEDAELLLVDAPSGLLEDARLLTLLEEAPCDVAVAVGGDALGPGPVLVPFAGAEHDWAAAELAASLARALGRPLKLAGASGGASGRDASRLLASASLALQRGLGVHADPVIIQPSPAALVEAAGGAGVVVVGLTDRWQREGLGPARTALATTPRATTLLVRRGLRRGALAAPAGDTQFTWTVAVGPA